jgi:hypothetical protein
VSWTPEGEPVTTAGRAVTPVEGSSFCISTPSADLGGAGPHGVPGAIEVLTGPCLQHHEPGLPG